MSIVDEDFMNSGKAFQKCGIATSLLTRPLGASSEKSEDDVEIGDSMSFIHKSKLT